MATKRDLKKAIKATCDDLASQIFMARHLIPGVNCQQMEEAMIRVAALKDDSLQKINISFDKCAKSFGNTGEYKKAREAYFHKAYNKLISEFNAGLDEIVELMNKALPSAPANAQAE